MSSIDMPQPAQPPVTTPLDQEGEIIPCCLHLRTKSQCFMPEEMRAGQGFVRVATTAVYWCRRTNHAMGPDDDAARASTCQPGRSCFERPADMA